MRSVNGLSRRESGRSMGVAVERLERRRLMSVATTTSLSTSNAYVTVGTASDTFTATVAPATVGGVTPTGSITFFNYSGSGYPTETVPLDASGTASLTLPATTAGYMAYVAFYSGDATYAASNSPGTATAVNATSTVLQITKDTVPTSLLTGVHAAKGVVTVTLTNPTGTAITGPEEVNIFAQDYHIDTNTFTNVDVGSFVVKNLKLPPGGSHVVPVKVDVTNIAETAGAYDFAATVTNSAVLSSFASTGGSSVDARFTVAPATVTLAATVTAPSPVTVSAGKMLGFTLTVTNNGNVNSTGPATIAVTLTTAGGVTVDVVPVIRKGGTIKFGKSVSMRLKVKVPTSIAAGSYVPGVAYSQGNANVTAASATAVAVG